MAMAHKKPTMETEIEMKTISKHGQKVEEALKRLETCTKGKSTKIGDALVNLSVVYYEDKQFEESLKWERKALKFFSSSPDRVDKLAKTMYNLAVTLSKLGRLEEASRLQEESLSLYKSFIPADHYREIIGSVMHNYAVNQFVLGKHAQALRMWKESLAYHQAHLPADHPRVRGASEAVKRVSALTTAPTDLTTPPVSTVTTATQAVAMITTTTTPPVAKTITVTAPSTTTTEIT